MSIKHNLINNFERFPIIDSERKASAARSIAAMAIKTSTLTDNFSAVERIPRYADGKRENDVEHSYMLAVAAPEIAASLELELDDSLIRRYALVHDLLEVKVGDVATFDLSPKQLAEKERREHAAKQELLSELPPLTAADLVAYEAQDSREAIFVRMVDKLLPIAVDITGDGVRVVREDYGVQDHQQLIEAHNHLHARIYEKFAQDFPDLVAAHAVLCEMFEDQYIETVGEKPKKQEVLRGPVEVELKYLIDPKHLPATLDLENAERSALKQGYIAIGADGSETRVRSFDNERFELTVKSPGMIERSEQTSKISPDMFDVLWAQTAGRQVEKTRYYIPYDTYTIELDVYHGALEGLMTAEVEFDGRQSEASVKAATFVPPEWFGDNVSEDPRYKNHNLSQGKPHEPLVMGAKRYE